MHSGCQLNIFLTSVQTKLTHGALQALESVRITFGAFIRGSTQTKTCRPSQTRWRSVQLGCTCLAWYLTPMQVLGNHAWSLQHVVCKLQGAGQHPGVQTKLTHGALQALESVRITFGAFIRGSTQTKTCRPSQTRWRSVQLGCTCLA